MTETRPKRKATSNVNYKDPKESFTERNGKPPSEAKAANTSPRKSSKKASSSEAAEVDVVDQTFPINWQPPLTESDYFSEILDLTNATVDGTTLTLPDKTISKNDCIYMVSEPPGEPYYIGRVLGFVQKDKHCVSKEAQNFLFKINWYYRPRDFSRKSSDSRLLFATMHSDTCPIQSYRGMVTIRHKQEVEDINQFRSLPNHFYFDKLYDRYMMKTYDVLPTEKLIHLPRNYYAALNKRFPFIFVESGRGSDLLASPKNCEKCHQWCSSMDSVECVSCGSDYHMLCLDPPIVSKPKRGFAWFCAGCNKTAEREIEAKRGRMLDEIDQDDSHETNEIKRQDITIFRHSVPKYEELAIQFLNNDIHLTLSERRNIEEWPYRYLGIHARLEDAMDCQDRPYPRAASRLGPKHQCSDIPDWFGHPVIYYNRETNGLSKKPKKQKSSTPVSEPQLLPLPKEFQGTSPNDYPPWLMEAPKGYVERGGDDTITLMWKSPDEKQSLVENFLKECSPVAERLGLLPNTPNFMDAVLKTLLDCNYDFEKAKSTVCMFTRQSLKEPTLSSEEIALFEQGVKKFGSELHPVFRLVGTQSCANIVRFYYLWKKTASGRTIWGSFKGRSKNKAKASHGEQDIFKNILDDSSCDKDKIITSGRTMECRHCNTFSSVQWFKLTSYEPGQQYLFLCIRCAKLWRRYAVVWESPFDILKKMPQKGNGWKSKLENEQVVDAQKILAVREALKLDPTKSEAQIVKNICKSTTKRRSPALNSRTNKRVKTDVKPKPKPKPKPKTAPAPVEPKELSESKIDNSIPLLQPVSPTPVANYIKTRCNPDFIVPSKCLSFLEIPSQDLPKRQPTPCVVCFEAYNTVCCANCSISVHPRCYGLVVPDRIPKNASQWLCDPCSNDCHPITSTVYSCQLCGGHQALKTTTQDGWCDILCAVFNPFAKFYNIDSFQPISGIEKALSQQHIPCSICQQAKGFTMKVDNADSSVHLTCAQSSKDLHIGFKLVQGSAKDKGYVRLTTAKKTGVPVPVIMFSENANSLDNFFTFDTSTKKKNTKDAPETPILFSYIRDFKKAESEDPFCGCRARNGELMQGVTNIVKEERQVPLKRSLVDEKCSSCDITSSPRWYSGKCHRCFIQENHPELIQEEAEEAFVVPDLLNITHEKLITTGFGLQKVDDKMVDFF